MPNKPNFAAMTPEQRRDWLAEQEGWKRRGDRWRHPVYHKLGSGQKRHPLPNTLDAAAEAMPKGRTFIRVCRLGGRYEWASQKYHGINDVWVTDTGNEINDRFHLACECVWAEKGI